MQRGRVKFASILVLAAALVAGGCGSNGGSAGGGGEKLSLEAQGTKFTTTSLDLKAGQKYTLTLANKDSVLHNFTFQQANADKDAAGGATVEVTFDAPAAGSYKFFCKYHPAAMTGTVTVS